ncbi:MAG: ankyrin repeat domain-containing protein [Armatimonadota bacterium]
MRVVLLVLAVLIIGAAAVWFHESERPRYISARAAIEAGDLEDVEYHLSQGADLNDLDEAGYTLLHTAAMRNRPEITELLISRGLGPDTRDPETLNDYTALHLAARENSAGVAAVLLEAGADPDAVDARGRTPLHMAAMSDSADAARVLLEHDAEPNIRDNEDLTPLGLAMKWQKERVGRALVQHGATR